MRRPPKIPRPTPVPRVRSRLVDRLRPADVPAFWDEVATRLPLVEDDGGAEVVVTFCWRDRDAEAVLLFANRLTDETSLADTLLERLAGSDLWHASFRMGRDWRASYSFLVQASGAEAPWLVGGHVALRAALDRGRADPRNPETCENRAGILQSVVALPGAPVQPWLASRPDVPAGTLTEAAGPDGRQVWCYRPAGVAGSAPLVVALDGEVWRRWLPTILDNLIADGEIPPVCAVLPSSGGRDARWEELGGAAGVEYVVDALVPWARDRLPVAPGRAVVAGQSLGGLTALRAALLHPDRVVAVSQSASLWQDDLLGLVPDAAGACLHLAHGRQEWVLVGPHERLAERLLAAGADIEATSYNGGHDYAWWRGALADGLRWALRASG
jgi:enterochelin esterase family protein